MEAQQADAMARMKQRAEQQKQPQAEEIRAAANFKLSEQLTASSFSKGLQKDREQGK